MKNFLKKKVPIGSENDARRVAWVVAMLSRLLPGSILLDAGAGEQRFKKFCGHLKYVSQDFAQYDGKGDGVGLQMDTWDQSGLDIVSDITSIPKPDASFDAILCTEVFEHIPDPIAAIKEFSRLLKKGGHLIITAPFCSGVHFAPFHLYSGFSKYFFEEHLKKNGFEIVEMKNNGNFFEYLGQEIRRIPMMAKMYTEGKKLYPWEYLVFFLTLLILGRLNKANAKSEEFMCFGIFVHAIKK